MTTEWSEQKARACIAQHHSSAIDRGRGVIHSDYTIALGYLKALEGPEVKALKEKLKFVSDLYKIVHDQKEVAEAELSQAKAQLAALSCGNHPGMSCKEAHLDEKLQLEAAKAEITELENRLDVSEAEADRARAEIEEQSRLLGISGSKEAKLLAEIERLKAENESLSKASSTIKKFFEDESDIRKQLEQERERGRKMEKALIVIQRPCACHQTCCPCCDFDRKTAREALSPHSPKDGEKESK